MHEPVPEVAEAAVAEPGVALEGEALEGAHRREGAPVQPPEVVAAQVQHLHQVQRREGAPAQAAQPAVRLDGWRRMCIN